MKPAGFEVRRVSSYLAGVATAQQANEDDHLPRARMTAWVPIFKNKNSHSKRSFMGTSSLLGEGAAPTTDAPVAHGRS